MIQFFTMNSQTAASSTTSRQGGMIPVSWRRKGWKPLREKSDARCESLFENNFKNCNNGGVGGEIMAGCVKYIIKALPE